MEPIQVDPCELKKLAKSMLIQAGLLEEETECIADAIVDAEMAGMRSSGMIRIPEYVHDLKSGKIKSQTTIRIIRETLGTAVLSAENGWGQIAGYKGMQMAVEKAKVVGAGFIGIQSSNVFDHVGYFSNLASKDNCIGVAMTNNPSVSARKGSKQPMPGTGSVAVSLPARSGPVTFHMTGQNHVPLNDARQLLGDQSLMIDILSGVLTGAAFGADSSEPDDSSPRNAGHFLGAVDVEAFMEPEEFMERMEEFCRQVRNGRSHALFKNVYLPGEYHNKIRLRSQNRGIRMSPRTIEKLMECSLIYRIELPDWIMGKR